MEREGRNWRAWKIAAALHGRENIRPVPHPRLDRWVSQYCSWDLLGEKTRQVVFETVPHGKQLSAQDNLPQFKEGTLVSSMLVFLTRRCT